MNGECILTAEGKRVVDVFDSNTNATKRMIALSDYYKEEIKKLYENIMVNVYDSADKDRVLSDLIDMSMYLNKAIFHFDTSRKMEF